MHTLSNTVLISGFKLMHHSPSRTTTGYYIGGSSMNHGLALKVFHSKMTHINYTDVSLPK